MLKISNLKLPLKPKESLGEAVCRTLGITEDDIQSLSLIRRSLDARRGRELCHVHTVLVSLADEGEIIKKKIKNVEPYYEKPYIFPYKKLCSVRRPVVIGTGPGGLFCALMLARAGLCPLVFERGQSVDERTKTVEDLRQSGHLNPNSNVQFGEGGAGTFSDGKLTCGLNDTRIRFVLNEFANAGAPEEITYLAKPHIGTDYLKTVVKSIREEIESLGGKVRFGSLFADYTPFPSGGYRVTIEDVATGKKEHFDTDELVLALGHSARDTYELLRQKGIRMEKKPFSVGVRIEHKREYIDRLMYRDAHVAESLPAADYKLSCHPGGRGVYTFCMCPGGEVVCGSSEDGGVVTNGMSYFARDMENSNSALLVSVYPEDLSEDVFSGIELQRSMEQKAYVLGGGRFFAPCQRVGDYLNGISTHKFGSVAPSYKPGVKGANLWDILPPFVAEGIAAALTELDTKVRGFCLSDAVLTGVETRSSAPIRIVRDEKMHSSQRDIYPVGEGAGYAGGIMSAAVDGIKCAEIICNKYD